MQELNKILEEVFGIKKEEINDELDIRKTKKWDSLNHIHFVFAVEKAYDIELEQDDIIKMIKVSQIKKIILSKKKKGFNNTN